MKELQCIKSVKKMFWAAFGQDIRTRLVPLDSDPESVRGGVTSRVIIDLYKAFLLTIVYLGDIFMQDRALVYIAYIVKDLLQEIRIQVMVWPPYLPDLNLIKNLGP